VSIGLVIALEYENPRFDPHAAFQTWKTHPYVRKILEGGKLVRYGAKSLPYGGWYAMPENFVDGGLIVGDSGSFLDSQRLKGIHLAMKTGMLAAETVFESARATFGHAPRVSGNRRKDIKEETGLGCAKLPSIFRLGC
jgi:electron-transferring-flavoprotein dehydrogenase